MTASDEPTTPAPKSAPERESWIARSAVEAVLAELLQHHHAARLKSGSWIVTVKMRSEAIGYAHAANLVEALLSDGTPT